MENENTGTVDKLISNLQDQFDAQRARMRELYLHKENECAQLKQKVLLLKKDLEDKDSQLVIAEYCRKKDLEDQNENAQAEILTLQQLLQETCDEATVANSEIARLGEENEKLKQIREALQQQHADSNKSLESILGLKTLARNVKKITGVSNSQESLDGSTRKQTTTSSKYAQEDADTLRSLVPSLEDEIHQLKMKLREAYDEMEKNRGIETDSKSALVGLLSDAQEENQTSGLTVDNCTMCKNYEIQLVQSQDEKETEKSKTLKAEKIMERLQQDLLKESDLRLDLEKTWQVKREEHKDEVQKLCATLNASEQRLAELQNEFSEFKTDLKSKMVEVVEERQKIFDHLENLQKDNEFLSGRYLKHSEELKNEDINLPQSVSELQEALIILNENLIESKVGMEFNHAKCISFRDEASLLRDQMQKKDKEREFLEQKFNHRIHILEDKLKQQHHIHLKLLNDKEAAQKVEIEYKREISDLRMQNISLRDDLDKLEKVKVELKSRAAMMQQELSTSETVQKDFVKLSQQLQMQLEKIRSADTQVRWQDEDDVSQCPTCKADFTVTRRKQNCRHCGTIFCESCCNRQVKSGPNSKKSVLVCEFCHFLLERNTTPFFSHATPKSP